VDHCQVVSGSVVHVCKSDRRKLGAIKQGKPVSIDNITDIVSKAFMMYAS